MLVLRGGFCQGDLVNREKTEAWDGRRGENRGELGAMLVSRRGDFSWFLRETPA